MTVIGRRSAARAQAAEPALALYSLRIADLWRFVKKQPISFWLLNGYLFFEYVRPQSIYTALSVLPWAQICIYAAAVTAFMKGEFSRKYGTADLLMGVFTAIILIGCLTAYSPSRAFERLPIWLSWLLIYLIYTAVVNTEQRMLVVLTGFILYNFKMSLHGTRSWAQIGFGFRDWGVTGAPGWFQNSGEFGIEMAIFLSISGYFFFALRSHWPKWKQLAMLFVPVTAVIGGIGSSSRGALIGFAAVAAWMLMWSKYRIMSIVAAVILTFGVIFLVPPESKARWTEIGSDSSSVTRLTYWRHGRQIMREHPVFGIGFENWLPYYRANYNPRGQVSHNPFIQAGSELGFPGLLTYTLMIVITMKYNIDTRKRAKKLGESGRFLYWMGHGMDGALMGYLASGFFVTVLYYPFFWINLAMTVSLNNIARSRLRAAQKAAPPGSAVPARRR